MTDKLEYMKLTIIFLLAGWGTFCSVFPLSQHLAFLVACNSYHLCLFVRVHYIWLLLSTHYVFVCPVIHWCCFHLLVWYRQEQPSAPSKSFISPHCISVLCYICWCPTSSARHPTLVRLLRCRTSVLFSSSYLVTIVLCRRHTYSSRSRTT